MMTEEEVERMVQRLMQCLDCIYNSTDCEGEDGNVIGVEDWYDQPEIQCEVIY